MLATFPDITRRKTKRLDLRPPSDGDLPFLTDLFSRHEMVAHRPHPVPDSPAQSAARLVRDLAHWEKHRFGRWALEMSGHLIGFGGLSRKDGIEELAISYHLHPDFWRRGFATELVDEALRIAFDLIRAPKVIGLVRPVNPASRAVLERSGFSFEGEVDLDGAPTLLLAKYPSCIV